MVTMPMVQCCHSYINKFPYNNNEKSLHIPTQSASKVHTTPQLVFIVIQAEESSFNLSSALK